MQAIFLNVVNKYSEGKVIVYNIIFVPSKFISEDNVSDTDPQF